MLGGNIVRLASAGRLAFCKQASRMLGALGTSEEVAENLCFGKFS